MGEVEKRGERCPHTLLEHTYSRKPLAEAKTCSTGAHRWCLRGDDDDDVAMADDDDVALSWSLVREMLQVFDESVIVAIRSMEVSAARIFANRTLMSRFDPIDEKKYMFQYAKTEGCAPLRSSSLFSRILRMFRPGLLSNMSSEIYGRFFFLFRIKGVRFDEFKFRRLHRCHSVILYGYFVLKF